MPKVKLAPYQFVAMVNPFTHFAMLAGVGVGKSYTGSHFAIKMIREHPELTGFIGANTYDQLSQATLKEFFYWLDAYGGFEFVSDRKPPPDWKPPFKLKKYANTVHVRNKKTGQVTLIFTRVLAKGDKLRGIEFSWYWIDETRDTPRNTHDVILSRLRESEFVKGLITTTPNGRDWVYERFKPIMGNRLYGSMHVKTEESVRYGIIPQAFYDALRATYSPMMAAQELDAMHVNVNAGRAYYTASDKNRTRRAPWGDTHPDPSRPLIIGCDFNYSPAPCVWVVGQNGPAEYHDNIHWFEEISGVERSTVDMARTLGTRFGDFFLRIFGDVSGGKGTTSNAGEHDYAQINQTLSAMGVPFSIDFDQANPLVRDRVENMCRMLYSASGEILMTYNPELCPLFDLDMNTVGWRQPKGYGSGKGKLDSGGNVNATHASDAGGYAVYKVNPPKVRQQIIESVPSSIRSEYGLNW